MKHTERLAWIIGLLICFFGWMFQIKNSQHQKKLTAQVSQKIKENAKKVSAANQVLKSKDTMQNAALTHATRNIINALNKAKDSIINSKSTTNTITLIDTLKYLAIGREQGRKATLQQTSKEIVFSTPYSLARFIPATDSTPERYEQTRFSVHIIPKVKPMILRRFLGLNGATSIVTEFTSDNPIVDFDGKKSYTYVQRYPEFNNRVQLSSTYNITTGQATSGIIYRHDFSKTPFSINSSFSHNWMLKSNTFSVGTTYDIFK